TGEVAGGTVSGSGGAAHAVTRVRAVLEVREVPLQVPVQLPPAAEPERGVELLVALEPRLEAEVVVQPGALGTEEDGEVLQRRPPRPVQREPVEEVAVCHVAAEPVDEPRLVVEPVAQSFQQIVESPGAAGPVPLRLPDRGG